MTARRAFRLSRREFLAGTAAALGLWSCSPAAPSQPSPHASPAAQQHRDAGELHFAVAAALPSLDAHRASPVGLRPAFAAYYSTLR